MHSLSMAGKRMPRLSSSHGSGVFFFSTPSSSKQRGGLSGLHCMYCYLPHSTWVPRKGEQASEHGTAFCRVGLENQTWITRDVERLVCHQMCCQAPSGYERGAGWMSIYKGGLKWSTVGNQSPERPVATFSHTQANFLNHLNFENFLEPKYLPRHLKEKDVHSQNKLNVLWMRKLSWIWKKWKKRLTIVFKQH
jgi:hypothetical protein